MMDDNLIYSEDALVTRIPLRGADSDINIVIEDFKKEYIYEDIFKRLFKNEYTIGIFAANGKPAVKSLYDLYGEKYPYDENIKLLYLFDGDFERYVSKDTMIEDRCCIYLEYYNIENYYIDEYAVKLFAKHKFQCTIAEVDNKLDFQNWLNRIIPEVKELFFLYCYIQMYYPADPNVSISCFRFIDDKSGFAKQSIIDQFINIYRKKDADFEKKITSIKESYKEFYGDNYFNLICGKFLFSSLTSYLLARLKSAKIKNKFYKDDFQSHLIHHFDISKLDFIKKSAISII